MSIEEKLDALTVALNRNSTLLEKMAGAGGTTAAASTGDTKAAGKTGKGTKAKTVSVEEMQAALVKLKDKHGTDESRAVIKKAGKVDKMADIKPADYQAVYDAAVAKFDELEAGDGDGDGDDDGI